MQLYLILASFSIAFLSLGMAVALLVRQGYGVRNLVFAAFNLSVFSWAGSYFFWQLSSDAEGALFWCRMLAAASIFIPVTYFHFISLVTGNRMPVFLFAGYLTAGALAILSPGGAVVAAVAPQMMFDYWPVPGPLFSIYIGLFIGYVATSFIMLIRKVRASDLYVKNQLRYLLWGMLLGFAGGFTNFPLWFEAPIPPIGHALTIVYVLGTGYAMIKYRLMELDYLVVRILVFVCAAFAVSVVGATLSFIFFLATTGIVGINFFAYWLFIFGIALIMLWLLPLLREGMNKFLDTALAPGKQSGIERLRQLAKTLVGRVNDEELFRYSVSEIGEALRANSVAAYFTEELDSTFRLRAAYGSRDQGDHQFPSDHSLIKSLSGCPNGSVFAEFYDPGGEGDSTAPFEASDLFFPIQVEGHLSGFLVIAPLKGRRLHSVAVLSLLEAICFQIGLLVRSRYVERRAGRAEKLIALGTLAAGLAHELRNPLVSIRTFTGLIGEQGGDAEFLRQFSSVVERDVNRIGAIIDQVAAFASNPEASFSSVQLVQVIHDVQDIAKVELKEAGVALTIEETALPLVRGNYSQLIQVFLNLLQNAIHALAASASPAVEISFLVKRRKDGGRAVVAVVSDNGPGIPIGIRQRIFDPFVTTKNTGLRESHYGMGLGLGIVKCIVEAHGGSIDVGTKAHMGATFYVELPCDEDDKSRVPIRSGRGRTTKLQPVRHGEEPSVEIQGI